MEDFDYSFGEASHGGSDPITAINGVDYGDGDDSWAEWVGEQVGHVVTWATDDDDDEPEQTGWEWAKETATSVIETAERVVEENTPAMPWIAALAMTLGVSAGTVIIAGGVAVTGGAIYALGYGPNVKHAIRALDPTSVFK